MLSFSNSFFAWNSKRELERFAKFFSAPWPHKMTLIDATCYVLRRHENARTLPSFFGDSRILILYLRTHFVKLNL